MRKSIQIRISPQFGVSILCFHNLTNFIPMTTFQPHSVLNQLLNPPPPDTLPTVPITDIEFQRQSQKSSKSGRKLVEIPCQTVEVLSDEEEVQIMNENFKAEAFRVKIEEAKLTRSKNNILTVLYVEFNFPELSDKAKEKKFNALVKGYMAKNLKTSKGEPFDMKNSHFSEKMLANHNEDFVENEYILFGCDLLCQRSIERMFQLYGPSIKWIDASHCRLTFTQKIKGWQAVVSTCKDFESFRRQVEEGIKVESLMNNLNIENQQLQEEHDDKSPYNEEYRKLQKFKNEYHLLKHYVELAPYYEMGFKRRLLIRNATSREQALGYNLNKSNPLTKASQQQIPVNPSPLSSLDHPLNVSEIPLNESNLAFDQSQLRIDHNLTHIDISQPQQKGESDYKKYLRVKDALWKQIENSPKVKAEYDKISLQISREQENLYLAKRSSKPTYTQPSGEFNAKPSNPFYGNRPNRQSELNQKQYDQFHNFTQQEDFNRDNPNHENSSRKYERERSRQGSYQNHTQPCHAHTQQNRFTSYNKQGGYRGQNFNRGRDFKLRERDMIEKNFDSYLQAREQIQTISNITKTGQKPEFVHPETGTLFYRNPYYQNNQTSSYPPPYNQTYNHTKKSVYSSKGPQMLAPVFLPSQSQNESVYHGTLEDEDPQNYEYKGTRARNQAKGALEMQTHQLDHQMQLKIPIQSIPMPPNFSRNQPGYQQGYRQINQENQHFQRIQQNRTNPQHKHYNSINIAAETEFQRYCAQKNQNQRQNTGFNGSRVPGVIQQTQNQINDSFLEVDPDFSRISEDNSHQQESNIPHSINLENMENILEEIVMDRPSSTISGSKGTHNNRQVHSSDEECQDLEFIIREREQKDLKSEVKVENNDTNIQKNFIEEQIKPENLQDWTKTNYKEDRRESYFLGQPQVNQMYPGENQTVPNQLQKKSVPKKRAGQSSSLKKRKQQSVGKGPKK